MSTSDQDMLLILTAEQIRRREFATIRRGYDPEQVRAYLTSLADQFEPLEEELRRLRLEVNAASANREETADAPTLPPAPAEDPYESLSKRFATLIEVADQEAEKILENAKSEATRRLDEATGEADRIKVDAQARAEEGRQEVADLLERATTEADRVLSTLAERRRNLSSQLEQMRAKLIAMAEDLATPIDDPSERREDDAEAEDEADTADTSEANQTWAIEDEPMEIHDLEPLDLSPKERHD